MQHSQDPRALANSASSARVTHQEATCEDFICAQCPACVTLSLDRTTVTLAATLCHVKMYDKKQRQPLYMTKKEADTDNFKLHHRSKALRDIPVTNEQHSLSSRIRTRHKTRASCPWKSGFPLNYIQSVPSPHLRERLFQPILYNLNLPKSGKRAPFYIFLCSAKVLYLN